MGSESALFLAGAREREKKEAKKIVHSNERTTKRESKGVET